LLTVTFQFKTVEAAVDFLRAVDGPKPEQVVVVKLPDPQPERKERKPRSDAGQPRGPYKRGKEESPAEAAAPATQTPAAADTPPAAAAPEAAAAPAEQPAASDPTLADVRAAMTGRATEKNIALLAKFGYAKSSELPPAKYAEFIAACKRGE
jgi:hypothetical protein